ncbi:LutC/YkgG family protein [Deinococcus yavapaiensis]|uniref:L-lactate dehydrogenase complex protein LldG n=1 Tax=Deinococcus yavapaiensis KR-236 TaxID=694435 RepID=A0A318RZ78_9DEIO|nr:lactate utilization protein C [Deinococcus yavapaiensis]PYE49003.1 L-lactate dehydrogenase complex protein LldG [Deinococcus yavapaiensis KR-236]
MSAEAKLDILTRIARARATPTSLDRRAVSPSERAQTDVVEQFAHFAEEYRATVVHASRLNVGDVVETLLRRRNHVRVVTPPDFPAEFLPKGVHVRCDEDLDTEVLDTMQAVLTTCAVAVAETGTVALDHGPGQGRRALTLVPDHHVCVIRVSQVVDSVPEAVACLRGSVLTGRPLTWISGPSATSDIELSRVEGVHGPRILDLVLVQEA